ncbi:TonB-dependent receptor [Arenibacter sp. F26102]|uniref:SusC/RagA family TonB-linked outer membrane protein n=1 Tax=Arenibacter sp. F26102 TaxID=2926416 RepID=UPI001FF1DD8D|nr:TonB-dependent receptor [Arenibacter sp. F26102]MCK0147144.1 TonB-dependent receptor [Arenibacter sp. F26102]
MKIKLTKTKARIYFRERLLFLLMKTFILLFCTTVFGFNVENTFSQEKVIIDHDQLATVDQVFKIIRKQTNYNFLYPKALFKDASKVQLRKGEIMVGELLEKSLDNINLNYELSDNGIIFIRESSTPIIRTIIPGKEIQGIEISGTIFDDNGQPLPGANILEKGTNNGTQSDFDGNFELTITDQNSTLVVSYLGFTTKEVPLEGNTTPIIVLQENAAALEEIIVVGYGTQKKTDVTGSVSSVGNEDLNLGGTTTNVATALQGRASGVQVQQGSSAPGTSPSVVIRGSNSINTTNEPLYVVDGFILDEGKNINPNDIENIQVLKDASATAIYGSRGGNGVVLITTKKGKKGKMQIEADISDGIQSIINVPSVINGQEYADTQNAIAAENSNSPIFPTSFPISNTDWFDLATRQARVVNRSINFSGSDESSKIFMSLNYLSQEGVLRNTDYVKYSARMGAEKKFSDKTTVGFNFYGSIADADNSDYTANITSPLFRLMDAPPTIPVYNEDGSYYKYNGRDNALALLLEPTNAEKDRYANGNMFVDYKILKNLTYHFGAGAEYTSTTQDYYTPRTLAAGEVLNGTATQSVSSNLKWITDQYLTYKLTLGEHDLTALLGTSNQKDYSEFLSASASGFANDILTSNSLDSGDIAGKPYSVKQETKLKSYFGRLNYAFGDKYLATFTLRRDGSNRFGPNFRYGTFPSAAIGWRLSNESFMENSNVFSNLKFRASWGVTGNDRIGNLRYLATYRPYGTVLNPGVFVGGTEPKILANPNLKWEETTQTNFGLDMGFINGRINATIDLYRKTTDDVLLDRPIGYEWGFSSVTTNAGKIQNEGLELAINTVNILKDKFTWGSAFNIAFNKQKVISLSDGVPLISSSTANPSGLVTSQEFTRLEPGMAMGELYGYQYAGVIKSGETYAPQPTSQPGDPKYVDINNDGEITAEGDRTYLGNTIPKFIAGFGNDITYKDFDLNIFFQGAFDYSLYNMRSMVSESTTGTDVLNRWVANVNEDTDIPRDGYYSSVYGSYVNSKFVEDASYVRLKNVSLGYNIPQSALKQVKFVDAVRLYASGQNLITITKYSGNDPEVNGHDKNATESNIGGGIDFNSFPAFRTFVLGLKITLH